MTMLLSLLLAAAPASAAPAPIGAAAAVSGGVTARAPQAAVRTLAGGAQVYHDDDVTTDDSGRLQVLLLDQTVFTLGPKSEVTLDDFVYDPFTDKGSVATTIKQGVFRFVTGAVGRRKPSSERVSLPVGTLGIRGTIAAGRVEGQSSLIALLGPGSDNDADERAGAIVVSNAGASVTLDRPGTATRVPGPGQAPLPPFPLTPELLAQLSLVPAPAAAAGGGPGAAGSAAQNSGQATAAGRPLVAQALDVGGDQQSTDETTALASQQAQSQFTTWDDLRAIPSGQAFYRALGTYSCTGGPCSTGDTGSFTLHFNIDFGARTLGGSGSSSHVAFDSTGTGALNPSPTAGGNGSAPALIEAQIPTISFASLAGQAKLTFGADFTAANNNAGFNGTSFQFQNGVKQIGVDMKYNGSNDSLNNGYASGATASGTATGSCESGSCP